MQEFKLPDLGEGMQEAEIRRWLVKPGDMVKLDQPMVEVETDKAVVEIPSPIAGQVAEIYVPEGQAAKLGEVLVTFATSASSPSASARTAAPNASAAQAPEAPVSSETRNVDNAKKPRVLAAPAVRKRAFELGINLADITPSQPHGRITLPDVEIYAMRARNSAVASPANISQQASMVVDTSASTSFAPTNGAQRRVTAAPSREDERQPLTGLRKRIAERMERSWRTIPHATAFDEADGGELLALRQSLKPLAEQRGVRLTYLPLLAKLLLPVLKEFPTFNANFDEERREIVYKHVYHLGIAADSPEGLLVPVLRDADQLSVIQLAQQLEHLIAGAQKRTLALSEVSGSTFTLNNIGSFGGGSGTPIINYPEVAILAVGRLQEKAVVRAGTLVARPMLPLALSFDHRIIDGALAGRFLARFKALVEQPQQLLLDLV
jgi:pyruvate dehydrogenase E2 component (dihydrolipoamide acetyltransferase)